MPVIVGNSTINTAITSASVTENTPQGFAVYNATRNTVMPTLRLDFVNSNVLDPRITFTRASSATYFNSAGVMTTASTDVPRFDYNPATGVCNGLLIEQVSTNVVYNSGAAGAVVGTPGTNPTNWNIGAVFGPTGLSTSIIGTGSESGIPYVDVRFFGTPTSTSNGQRATFTLAPGTVTGGQTWTGSVYCTLVGGSLTNVSYFLLEVSSGNPIFNGNSTRTFTPTVSALNNSRISTTHTLPTGSTILGMGIVMGFTINLPIDVTIRIAAPQLELLPFVTSFITTGVAGTATRAADQATIALGSWYNKLASTLMFGAQKNTAADPNFSIPLELDDGSFNNRVEFYTYPSTSTLAFHSQYTSNISDVAIGPGSYTTSTPYKVAGAITGALSTPGIIAASLNGATAVTGITGNFAGAALTTMRIGSGAGGLYYLNGWMQGVSYYTVALSNNELISLTS